MSKFYQTLFLEFLIILPFNPRVFKAASPACWMHFLLHACSLLVLNDTVIIGSLMSQKNPVTLINLI